MRVEPQKKRKTNNLKVVWQYDILGTYTHESKKTEEMSDFFLDQYYS